MACASTHIISLTVTEKAYRLDASAALDLADPEIVHDHSASGQADLSRRLADGRPQRGGARPAARR